MLLCMSSCNESTVQNTDEVGSSDYTPSDTPNDTPSVDPALIGTVDKELGLVIAEKSDLSDADKKALYELAGKALEENRVQYAYGLYSRLAVEGYSDSATKAAELRARANATPVAYVSLYAFDNFHDKDAVEDHGFIYADENGTPRVLYAAKVGDSVTAKTFTPDATLNGVISFKYDTIYSNELCICLKSDGTLHVFYDESHIDTLTCNCEDGDLCPHELARTYVERILYMIESFKGEKNVVDHIIAGDSMLDYAFVHSDGTVSFYHKGSPYDSAIKGDFTDIVDFSYLDYCGLKSNGKVVSAENSIYIGLDRVHLIDEFFVLNDGRAYYTLSGEAEKLGYTADAVYATCVEVGKYYFISGDGNIYDQDGKNIGGSDKVAYIYGQNKPIDVSLAFIIGTDGKINSVETFNEEIKASAWYDALSESIKTVKVKAN